MVILGAEEPEGNPLEREEALSMAKDEVFNLEIPSLWGI
jgi:hypothetical protein